MFFRVWMVLWVVGAWGGAATSAELGRLLKGPLTKETLKDVIHEHHAEVKRCATARPADLQAVSGKIVVHFMIGKTGTVREVRTASSTLNEPSLEGCLVKAVTAWRFPKPKHGDVEVNFPFRVGPAAPAPDAKGKDEGKGPVPKEEDLLE